MALPQQGSCLGPGGGNPGDPEWTAAWRATERHGPSADPTSQGLMPTAVNLQANATVGLEAGLRDRPVPRDSGQVDPRGREGGGLACDPHKHMYPGNETLFGQRAFADVIM